MTLPVDRSTEATRLQQVQIDYKYDNDLISSLPLELKLQIANYLDPADIIQSQRVRNCPCADIHIGRHKSKLRWL